MNEKINITDLRIGNFVLVHGIMVQVEELSINPDRISCNANGNKCMTSIDNVSPICVGPAWLRGLGFYVENPKAHKIYNEDGNIFQLNFVDGVYEFTWGAVPVKYVHHLQNLYSDLTGQSLNRILYTRERM